jgi:hypothetical protein
MTENNRGIIVNGGALTADSLAVGENAQVINGAPGSPAELVGHLARIEAAIEAHRSSLLDPDDLKAAILAASSEARRGKPNSSRIVEVLKEIAVAASSVSPVVELVKSALSLLHRQ